jgi:hypothetical protein
MFQNSTQKNQRQTILFTIQWLDVLYTIHIITKFHITFLCETHTFVFFLEICRVNINLTYACVNCFKFIKTFKYFVQIFKIRSAGTQLLLSLHIPRPSTDIVSWHPFSHRVQYIYFTVRWKLHVTLMKFGGFLISAIIVYVWTYYYSTFIYIKLMGCAFDARLSTFINSHTPSVSRTGLRWSIGLSIACTSIGSLIAIFCSANGGNN